MLVHVDTNLLAKGLLNQRMAYVAISRSQWDARIFTSDRKGLVNALSRVVSHASAYKPEQAIAPVRQGMERAPAQGIAIEQDMHVRGRGGCLMPLLRREGKGEDGDVVFLSVVFGGVGNVLRAEEAELREPV